VKIIRSWTIPVKHYKRRMAEARCPKCTKLVVRIYSNAIKQKSCGCDRAELNGKAHYLYKHGREPRQLYQVWKGIRERCSDPKNSKYNRYGGRGITVCCEWQSEYMPFRNWALTHGWRPGLEIDRRNNDGNYTPKNCRFVTRAVNCQNRSNNKLTPKKVVHIRKLIKCGKGPSEIGRMFNVSETMVRMIRKGETWVN
jgi:hypothetical protein